MRIGAYEVTGELGRGATAIVHAARAPDGSAVAVKLLAAPGRATKRFDREVEALRRLRHPGVVGFVEAGEHQGRPFLVTELVDGETLQARLDRAGALPAASVVELGVALGQALVHAHGEGVLHRDLKPDNVLLGVDGRARLADFGLARELEASLGSLTASGQLLGTPGYWAPEQAAGAREAFGPATDVWGLGAVLYAALTREPPFTGRSMAEVCVATASRAVTPPSTLAAVPRDLEAVVLRCLEKEPSARWPSAAAVTAALEGCRRGRRRRRRHGRTGLALGLLGGALLAAAGAAALLRRSEPRALPPAQVAPLPSSGPLAVTTSAAPPPSGAEQRVRERFGTREAYAAEVARLDAADRNEEAQELLEAGPEAWLGGAERATLLRSAGRAHLAFRALEAGRAESAARLFEEVVALLEAAPAPARDGAVAVHLAALLQLGRIDAACDLVAARPHALRSPSVHEDLISVLARRCPSVRSGPWSPPDPTGADDLARVLSRLVAADPAAPSWVHLLRVAVERARGNLVGADAALRAARAVLQPDELQTRLVCASWLVARGRPDEAGVDLVGLAALPVTTPEPGAWVGRWARLLQRLVDAERALAVDDVLRAAAILEGLAQDGGMLVAHDTLPADRGLVEHARRRRDLVEDDPRVQTARRLASEVYALSDAGEDDPLRPLADQPAALVSSALVQLAVTQARMKALSLTRDPAALAEVVRQLDGLARVVGRGPELLTASALLLLGRSQEARDRLTATRLECPGLRGSRLAITLAIDVQMADRLAGSKRPAWSPGIDPAAAAAVEGYLAPWLPTDAREEEGRTPPWSRDQLVHVASAVAIVARCRAARGDARGADETLRLANELLGADPQVTLERATLLLTALHDPAGARAVLGAPLRPADRLRYERLLQLAEVEEAHQADQHDQADALGRRLLEAERATPSTLADDSGADFLRAVSDAVERAAPRGR